MKITKKTMTIYNIKIEGEEALEKLFQAVDFGAEHINNILIDCYLSDEEQEKARSAIGTLTELANALENVGI